MAAHGGGEYKDLIVFLAAAGVVVPLFNRLKISPVLGFLAAGVLLGPDGLARFADRAPWLGTLTISDAQQIRSLSELGVAFLLFMIGLELSWERLKAMRKMVFGLGLTQVVLCTVGIAAVLMLMGQPLVSAAVLGMGLALSSTAVVMPVMAERGRLGGATGRATFSILLAQDLAVAPILITVTVLAAMAQEGVTPAGEFDPSVLGPALFTLVPAAIGLALIVVLGRLVLRPMFRSVAKARSKGQGQELFVAASLLVVVGAGLAAQAAGLSMSLGALVAGLLLAETEFRREVEVSIEPFKGLLLGVFFVGVGIALDLDAVAADPAAVFGLAAGLTLLKAGIIYGAARAWGVKNRNAIETALVLGPAGEFAFVILGAGLVEGIASPAFTQTILVAATISMFSVPLMALIADRLLRKVAPAQPDLPPEALVPSGAHGEVLIVGFGRVGRLVGEMLHEHGQSFMALDANAVTVAKGRAEGSNVFYGDAARADMLDKCGIESVRAVVVTMDAPTKVDEVVAAVRSARPEVILIARARDSRHAERLYRLGVTDAVPETTEASLQLAENTLVDLGVPMGLVLASIHERRDRFRKLFQEAMPDDAPARRPRALRSTQRS
ncbi:cation:proton antiporter domain-containing protein [Brevundimonas sp. Root1279]|uniref:cation:proton antiporter domain-containing protein n=1 Tax=Brevundimonas sp. Root1279 TaxID=1736443 RepID=UPI0006FCE9F6|nr:cation:proton antiporter [Brevundimonas sp. Root1279]KQW81859.1 potassium transporter TrkA [Brevundimonas sp. Root1279]